MTSLPQPVSAASGPSALEVLWERHRRGFQAIFWLLVLATLGYYGLKYYRQIEHDKKWSAFASTALLSNMYAPAQTDPARLGALAYESIATLIEELEKAPESRFDAAMATADAGQLPYILWLKACRQARLGDVASADATVGQLSSRFPNHPLCLVSPYPVQVREPVKEEKTKDKDPKNQKKPEKPDLKPAVTGAATTLLLDHLKAAKEFVLPAQFTKPEIPADAPRFKISFEGDYGDIVIALLPAAAPLHCKKFEALAAEGFWSGVRVDEIVRPGKSMFAEPLQQMHFGFASTKGNDNRSEWDTTSASPEDHVVEEFTHLSHFPGAVAARSRDGKSEVDRLYLCATDGASQDDSRQVFGYVVEGMEALMRICGTDFARAEDENIGRGMPSENITVKSVTKL